MRELVGRLAREDRTILVSSHFLVEVEQVCDWLIMIDEGRLVFQGPTVELLASAVISLLCIPYDLDDLERLQKMLASSGYSVMVDDHSLTVAVDGKAPIELAADINRKAMDEGIVLVELRPVSAKLEDRYLSMVGGRDA
jgi:ABC-2 type transport system ATP-binding protein